jgi:hypothetical protein
MCVFTGRVSMTIFQVGMQVSTTVPNLRDRERTYMYYDLFLSRPCSELKVQFSSCFCIPNRASTYILTYT